MALILRIINNRNFLLVFSLIMGLVTSTGVSYLKPLVLWILAVVMLFSSTSFKFSSLLNFRRFVRITLIAFLLNFVVFGIILLSFAHLFFSDTVLLAGFVVIAATPPGVAIIPFTVMYKGDVNYSTIGVLGAYLLAIVVSPLIIQLFLPEVTIDPRKIVMIMLQVILLPLLLSRLLLWKGVLPMVQKIRGKVVNWGFALIVYTIVGLNRHVIFSDWELLAKVSAVFVLTMFIPGLVYELLLRKSVRYQRRVSQNLLLTIKSSGFAAGTALALFGQEAALPSAFMAVFVLIYLVIAGLVYNR